MFSSRLLVDRARRHTGYCLIAARPVGVMSLHPPAIYFHQNRDGGLGVVDVG